MKFDVLMLNLQGPPLSAQETIGIRSAALTYLQHNGVGLTRFKIENLKLEGLIERTGTKKDAPFQGAKFRVDLGTEGGILRKMEFVIPWDTMAIQIEDDALLLFGKLFFGDEKKRDMLDHAPPPPGTRLN